MTQTDLFSDNHLNDISPYLRDLTKIFTDNSSPKEVRVFKGQSVGVSCTAKEIRFDGSDIAPDLDNLRLTGQLMRIYSLMQDTGWYSLNEISERTGDPESSVSAQLRNFRKERFGKQTINKRRRGEEKTGLWEYQLVINKPITIEDEKNYVV